MDNITQGVIGGWIMDKVVGKAEGNTSRWQRNKAFILGGFISNIPDLDIFVNKLVSHEDYMSEFLFHRSMSHSVFFNLLVALFVGRLCARKDRYKRPRWRWALGSYISILIGHLLVDAMTSYGGRYLLPLSTDTYSFNNIFVVDLFYTLPLIALWFTYIFLRKQASRKILYIIGAIWILLYPAFTFFSKYTAESTFTASLNAQGKSYSRVLTSPEPLQAFLWRGVVQSGQGYYEAYYSLFDKDKDITRTYIPNNSIIRNLAKDSADVQRVEQRAQGRTSYRTDGSGHVLIDVTKMGEILGWKNPGQPSSTFVVSPEGEVLGQARDGMGRFEGGFGEIRNQHWSRVWGNK